MGTIFFGVVSAPKMRKFSMDSHTMWTFLPSALSGMCFRSCNRKVQPSWLPRSLHAEPRPCRRRLWVWTCSTLSCPSESLSLPKRIYSRLSFLSSVLQRVSASLSFSVSINCDPSVWGSMSTNITLYPLLARAQAVEPSLSSCHTPHVYCSQ